MRGDIWEFLKAHHSRLVTVGALIVAWMGVMALMHGTGCLHVFPFSRRSLFIAVFVIIILGLIAALKLAKPMVELFYPDEKFERPLPRYGPAQALRKQRRFKEAMDAYREIADEYPDELRVYLEMMEIAMIELKDRSRARLIHQEGMEKLTEEKDREQLTRYLSRLCADR